MPVLPGAHARVETLAEKYAGDARIVKLDSSKNRSFCLGMKVVGLPTFLFFRDGQEVERLSGSKLRIDAIEAALKSCIPQHSN